MGGKQAISVMLKRVDDLHRGQAEGSWLVAVMEMAKSVGLDHEMWVSRAGTNQALVEWMNTTDSAVEDQAIARWREEMAQKPKLRTYRSIKDDWEEASILKRTYSIGARLLLRLRTGTNGLAVEMDRANGTAVTRRRCRLCQAPTEDEEHFLARCPSYEHLRKKWWTQVRDALAEFGASEGQNQRIEAAAHNPKDLAKLMLRCRAGEGVEALNEAIETASVAYTSKAWRVRRVTGGGINTKY
jgi:hypothetical protein